MVQRIPLTDMRTGAIASVIEIYGGPGLHRRLRALGIRPGVKLTKISAVPARGPVVVQAGGTQVSLGFGISYKIIVEVEQ